MKKALVALAIAAFASTASASIAGGPHDLSNNAGALLSSCQFCHAPHNSNVTGDYALIPLWNRQSPTSAIVYYTGTVDTSVAVGAGSFACLSCHDGASDLGQTYTGSRGFAATTTISAFAYANLGLNMQNDHPIGVNYVPGTEYATIATITGAGLKLYTANNVECGSCHDPHGTWNAQAGGAAFLRRAANVICSTCHLK